MQGFGAADKSSLVKDAASKIVHALDCSLSSNICILAFREQLIVLKYLGDRTGWASVALD